MIYLKLKNGKPLMDCMPKLNRYLRSCEVTIKGETEDNYMVVDDHGIEIPFPKHLLEANGIPISDNRFWMSASMYQHHFALEIAERHEKAENDLFDQFHRLVAQTDRILQNEDYGSICPEFVVTSALWGHVKGEYCIGNLLKSWKESDEMLVTVSPSLGPAYLISFGFSKLSGSIYPVRIWLPELKQVRRLVDEKTCTPEEWAIRNAFTSRPLKGSIQLIEKVYGGRDYWPRLHFVIVEQLMEDLARWEEDDAKNEGKG